MTTLKETTFALFTIHNAPSMTKKRRKDIAWWLRQQARSLVTNGATYTNNYTATYSVRLPVEPARNPLMVINVPPRGGRTK